jgi:hypothetical protein
MEENRPESGGLRATGRLAVYLPVAAQQLGPLHAVANPNDASTRCPGVVNPRNPAASTVATANPINIFMTASRVRSTTAAQARRGEPQRGQHSLAWRREAEKSGRQHRRNPKRNDYLHVHLP